MAGGCTENQIYGAAVILLRRTIEFSKASWYNKCGSADAMHRAAFIDG
jgi:hypothetical protein